MSHRIAIVLLLASCGQLSDSQTAVSNAAEPTCGHDVWDDSYPNDVYVSWLFAQRK